MANGSLTFSLPEEQQEFEDACKGGDFRRVFSQLDSDLRSHIRHNTHPEWDLATVEEIRKILHDLMADYNIFIP